MTKNIIQIFIALTISSHVKSQWLTPHTINIGGGHKAGGSIMIEDAIGGLVVNSVVNPAFMYTQDFIQPDAGSTTIIPSINDVYLSSGSGIDNAGNTLVNGNIMLEFTLGESASITLIDANLILTQGILQPYRLYVWTGLVNTSWMNPGNWEGGLIPDQEDEVLIPALCPHYPIITNGIIAKCKRMIVKANASITVENGASLKLYK